MKSNLSVAVSVALLAGLAACTTLVGTDPLLSSAQRDQEQRHMPVPAVDADADYESAVVESEIPVPVEAFAQWFRDRGAPRSSAYLSGAPTVPGVVRTEALIGDWQVPGDRRRVVFTDGHSAVEEIIPSTQPRQLRYVVWNLTNRIGRYTSYAVGEFVFSGDRRGTHVRWTYSYRPKVWPDGLFIRSFVRTDYRNFMASSLAAMRTQAIADLQGK